MVSRIFVFILFTFCFSLAKSETPIDTLLVHAKKEFGKGNYQKGLKLSYQAYEAAEKSKNKIKMADAAIQLGTALYMNKQPQNEILHYYFICRKLSYEANIEILKPRINHNIGSVYIEMHKPDSAVYYFSEVLHLLEGTEKYYELSKTHAVLAELYFINLRDQYEKAYPHVVAAEKYARLTGNPGDLAFALMKKGLYFFNKRDYKNSHPIFERAKQLYDSLSDDEGMQYAYRLVADSYAGTFDTNIIREYENYISLKDTLFRRESAAAIVQYKTEYETEKKERENKILQQENELKQARITRITNWILILVVVFLITLFIVFWRVQIINRKKQEAEINYRKKLQKERDRVSRDLHDNAGSLISFVGNKVDWIIKNKKVDTDLKNDLESIQIHSKKIMEGLRETLWTLNSKSITNIELVDKLKPFIKSHLLIQFKINDRVEVEHVLDSETVLNVFRCCQEIINNIHKHSNADLVLFDFFSTEKMKLCVQITDNGIGIKKEDQQKENHFGLRNLKARLDEVNALLEINNPEKGGTEIKITVN